jgi:dinuclear metal center YbgI/SA1388 family protein
MTSRSRSSYGVGIVVAIATIVREEATLEGVVTLTDIRVVVEELWPVGGAESWDAPGLVTGDPAAEVSRILLVVDPTSETVDEAIEVQAGLVIAHHPLLLRGVNSIAEDRYKGALLAKLIRGGCALVTAHTNADVVADGTSAVFAERLRLSDVVPIDAGAEPTVGIGRVGRLAEPVALGRLAGTVASILPPTAGGIRVSGDYDQPVQTIALCGGAGDAYLAHPAVLASDVYITADLRHHPASEAREQAKLTGGPALIDVSHWASEWLWLDVAARSLRERLPGLDIVVSEIRTDPWDFAIVQ